LSLVKLTALKDRKNRWCTEKRKSSLGTRPRLFIREDPLFITEFVCGVNLSKFIETAEAASVFKKSHPLSPQKQRSKKKKKNACRGSERWKGYDRTGEVGELTFRKKEHIRNSRRRCYWALFNWSVFFNPRRKSYYGNSRDSSLSPEQRNNFTGTVEIPSHVAFNFREFLLLEMFIGNVIKMTSLPSARSSVFKCISITNKKFEKISH